MSKNVTSPKVTYAQPKLAVYGGFAQLTASGSQNSQEGSNMGANVGPAYMA
jgi:hypothetical protein